MANRKVFTAVLSLFFDVSSAVTLLFDCSDAAAGPAVAADMTWLWVMSALVVLAMPSCRAHVGLYYPPARTYALDFLDNARTQPPCGMTRGVCTDHVYRVIYLQVKWYSIERIPQPATIMSTTTTTVY